MKSLTCFDSFRTAYSIATDANTFTIYYIRDDRFPSILGHQATLIEYFKKSNVERAKRAPVNQSKGISMFFFKHRHEFSAIVGYTIANNIRQSIRLYSRCSCGKIQSTRYEPDHPFVDECGFPPHKRSGYSWWMWGELRSGVKSNTLDKDILHYLKSNSNE